jgi:phosphoglycolate phosphatase
MSVRRAAPPRLRPAEVRVLILDLDGTLVDSYAAIAASLNHARAAFDLAPLPRTEVRRRVGRGLETLVAELVGHDKVEQGVRLFRERYAACFAESTRALPGALEALVRLRGQGLRLGVASNKPSRFTRAILAELHLLPQLDCILGPEEAGAPKPDPAMVRLCLERLEARAGEAAYVGDMVLDVETAARAGLPVILVEGGSSTSAELRATGERVLSSLAELPGLLRGAGSPG